MRSLFFLYVIFKIFFFVGKDPVIMQSSTFYLPKIIPKLVAFDLDGTLWYPEMYQLSYGSPFTVVDDGTKSLLTKNGKKVSLLGSTARILDELKTLTIWKETKIAWVSTTDEPDWAKECLRKFRTTPNKIIIGDCADDEEIYYGNKKQHFKNIKKRFPEINYDEMIFYDNQMDNIRNVRELGVFCVYCPDGMTQEIWEEGLKGYESFKEGIKDKKKNKL